MKGCKSSNPITSYLLPESLLQISSNEIMKILHFQRFDFQYPNTQKAVSSDRFKFSNGIGFPFKYSPDVLLNQWGHYKLQGILSHQILLLHQEITGHSLMHRTIKTQQSTSRLAFWSGWAATVLTVCIPFLTKPRDNKKAGLETTDWILMKRESSLTDSDKIFFNLKTPAWTSASNYL